MRSRKCGRPRFENSDVGRPHTFLSSNSVVMNSSGKSRENPNESRCRPLRRYRSNFFPFFCGILIIGAVWGSASRCWAAVQAEVTWGATVNVNDPPTYKTSGVDARKIGPGRFGDDYPRALRLSDGSWLIVFTSYKQGDPGYLANPKGGTILVIAKSGDNGRTWKRIATISDPDRDMDNGELIQLRSGDILLAARSVHRFGALQSGKNRPEAAR